MSQSNYLKTQLGRIATDAESTVRLVKSPEFREKATGDYYNGASHYPAASGALEYAVEAAVREVTRVVETVVPRIAAMEAEHARLIAIFEALDIYLDEETLATLELMKRRGVSGRIEDDLYRNERTRLSGFFQDILNTVQLDEREREHDQAHEALLACGFVYDEDGDCFRRGAEVVEIALTSGWECRYEWQYQPNGGSGLNIDSGKSGDFHRLLALIQPVQVQS